MRLRGLSSRATVAGVAVAVAVAVLASSASAHVEVSADKTQAGASDATVSFTAESESTTAGIVSLRVVLPAGIAPADVTWLSGPTGWSLTRATDGYTVAGPAVRTGKDAVYRVKITKLPSDASILAFKTLQTYSDGHIDRWIEIPSPGAAAPDNPAPVLTLAPASAPASSSSIAASTSAPSTPGPSDPASAPSDVAHAGDTGSSAGLWIAGLVVLVLAAVAGGVVLQRRQSGGRRRADQL